MKIVQYLKDIYRDETDFGWYCMILCVVIIVITNTNILPLPFNV